MRPSVDPHAQRKLLRVRCACVLSRLCCVFCCVASLLSVEQVRDVMSQVSEAPGAAPPGGPPIVTVALSPIRMHVQLILRGSKPQIGNKAAPAA